MLLLDRALSFDANGTSAEYTPRHDAWYADAAGNMPAWIGIELMAQTIAAHVGLLKRFEGEPPKQGALLGTRSYQATRPTFDADLALCIHARMIYRDANGLGSYECTISLGELDVASAMLKVFEPDDFQTFLQTNIS